MEREAERLGISVSTLITQIMRNFAIGYRYNERWPAITLSFKAFAPILNNIPDEKIAELGRISGSTIPKDFVLMSGTVPSLETLAFWIDNQIRLSGWAMSEHHVINKEHVFHLRHSLGSKWSIYLGEYMETMFKTLIGIEVNAEVFDDSVTIFVPNRIAGLEP